MRICSVRDIKKPSEIAFEKDLGVLRAVAGVLLEGPWQNP
jgi:hypothetical protein